MDPADPDGPPLIPLVPAPWDDGIPVVMPVAGPPVVHPTSRRTVRPTIVAPPPGSWEPEPIPVVRRARRRPVAARFASVVPLMVTMALFAGMMTVSFGQLAHAVVTHSDKLPTPPPDEIRAEIVRDTAVFEGLDTVLVFVGLVVAGRPLARRVAAPLAAWFAAVPGFALLLGANVGYCLLLRSLVKPDPDDLPVDLELTAAWWGWAVLLVCVQPAVVEELFFRYLLFGHLRPHVGLHGAVWVSAVVFGMAHLGNPVGWPVLVLLGAGLGYARAYSGSLALPVALHFLHNLCVLALNEAIFR